MAFRAPFKKKRFALESFIVSLVVGLQRSSLSNFPSPQKSYYYVSLKAVHVYKVMLIHTCLASWIAETAVISIQEVCFLNLW